MHLGRALLPRKGSWTAFGVRPAGCLARRNEAQLWVYSNELQRRRAPRGACPGGRSGLHLTGELHTREESTSNQFPAYCSKRSTALSRYYRPASLLVDRQGPIVKIRAGRGWNLVTQHINSFDSLFGQLADPHATPEVFQLREIIRGWRFYDHFRTDADAPARLPRDR